MTKHLEVVDKRHTNSEAIAEEELQETVIEQSLAKALSDLPRVYDDPLPMESNILVKQNAAETTYRGTTFFIPDVAQQSPNVGVVIAVGPEVNPEKLAPGDLVTFGRFNAEPIEVDGQVFQLVSYHDVKLRQRVTYAVARN